MGEPFVDLPNGMWDPGEFFIDVNNNGFYDLGEGFTDAANGIWDPSEDYSDIGTSTVPITSDINSSINLSYNYTNCINLNGYSDALHSPIINAADQNNHLSANHHTISLWFKDIRTEPSLDSGPGGGAIIAGLDRPSKVRSQIAIKDNKLTIYHGNENATNGIYNIHQIDNATIELNKWYHVALVSNGNSADLEIYLNGENLGIFAGGINENIESDFIIGALPNLPINADYRQSFKGSIDNVRLYNRSLTESEIRDIFYEEAPDIFIIEGAFTWEDALADAESKGGVLASLNTSNKINLANKLLSN